MIEVANMHLFLDRREELVSEFIADIGSEVGYIFDEWDEIRLTPHFLR